MLNERPVMRVRTPPYVMRRRRRWDGISWWFSILFVIPAAIIAFNALTNFDFSFGGGGASASNGKINVTVTDAYSGKKLAGATISLGGLQVQSDGNGHARLQVPDGAQSRTMTVQIANYESAYGEIPENAMAD